ncbi:MAG: tyrosine-type recombinase/integrase, partial [Pseudobdellovibrionaceae bacterium]
AKTSEADQKSLQDHRILFYLLYGCGLRVSEACQMKWSDLNFSSKTITVLGKGNKQRLITAPKIVFELLGKLKKPKSVFLFGDPPMDRRKAYELVRKSGIQAGLMKPLHPHALRHSFATHLLTSGADLRVLQELLGHSSMSATEKYTHLSTDHLANTLATKHPLK